MFELLKCFATGLAALAIALVIVSSVLASLKLVSIFPLAGGIAYVVCMVLFIAVGAGWVIRNA